ncbi:MAG TPA: TRAP transporter small permease [Rhabdaerophilum sp.]|nr:TRAP transporter small permease [Rhabdaerophilum sp.]
MSELYIRIEDAVSKLLLAIITLLVFAAAIARTLGEPMIWSVDVAQLLFVWLCFLGANRAMRIKTHIGVDFFVRKLPMTPRWILEIALGLLTLGFLLTLAYTGYKLTLLNWQRVYGDSGISYAWVTGAVPVGCALLSVTVLLNLVRAIRDRKLVFYADKANEIDRSETQLG